MSDTKESNGTPDKPDIVVGGLPEEKAQVPKATAVNDKKNVGNYHRQISEKRI